MSKQFYFEQFSLAKVRSLIVETTLFHVIYFCINTQFKCKNSRNHVFFLLDPKIGPLSGATTAGKSELGSDSKKGCSAFPKVQALLEPHLQLI